MSRTAWIIVAVDAAIQLLLLAAMIMLTLGLGLIAFALLTVGVNLALAAVTALLALGKRKGWPVALAFLVSAGVAALLSASALLYLTAS